LWQDPVGEGEIEAYVANVPSETYVGMSSLLPVQGASLEIENSKPVLRSEAANGDLVYRSTRWKVLESVGAAALGKDKKGARLDEIHHLLELIQPPKELPPVLVLFDRGVDQIGHSAGTEALHHFEVLLDDLRKAIRKLRSWGYGDIHLVTDHGFVLLHSSANIQAMEVDEERFALLEARSGFVKPGKQAGTAVVQFPLDPSASVALPPGLRSFAAPGTFFHGGATLQEVVIPHLRISAPAVFSRMRVRVQVPQAEIATLTVKIDLVPERPPRSGLFDAEPEAIRVRIFLGAADSPRSSEKTVKVGSLQTDIISVTLFLNREPPITKGLEIPVHVVDADTGEAYAIGLAVKALRDLG